MEQQALKNTDTHEKILESALVVFSHKGYTAATINNIARYAGLTPLTVFRHFEDKRNLFLSVVDEYADIKINFPTLDMLTDGKSIEKDLELLADAYFETIFSNIHILRIFIGEGKFFPELQEKMWVIPPLLLRHFKGYLTTLPQLSETTMRDVELTSEMFLSHIVRRALEYNKHDNIWEYNDKLAEDFRQVVRPTVLFMADFLLMG
ncbi:MAG: TetR/AcrR family transcriptional regulator [Christensenellaceae bacterium]|jgi:AcrR family transcriptional regulator